MDTSKQLPQIKAACNFLAFPNFFFMFTSLSGMYTQYAVCVSHYVYIPQVLYIWCVCLPAVLLPAVRLLIVVTSEVWKLQFQRSSQAPLAVHRAGVVPRNAFLLQRRPVGTGPLRLLRRLYVLVLRWKRGMKAGQLLQQFQQFLPHSR